MNEMVTVFDYFSFKAVALATSAALSHAAFALACASALKATTSYRYM
jgi:hypothetical protein